MTPEAPKIPQKIRMIAYISVLLADVGAVLGFGFAHLFGAVTAEFAFGGIALIAAAGGMLSAGLALGYVRTAPDLRNP